MMAIEPGLYIPNHPQFGMYAGIGVRIEDDVLVTNSGAQVGLILSGCLGRTQPCEQTSSRKLALLLLLESARASWPVTHHQCLLTVCDALFAAVVQVLSDSVPVDPDLIENLVETALEADKLQRSSAAAAVSSTHTDPAVPLTAAVA